MDKYVHSNGLLISSSDSYSLIQSVNNNMLKKINRIFSEQTGCFGSDFEVKETFAPVGWVGDANQKFISVKIGRVIFPTGEIFIGDGYTQILNVGRAAGYQYLYIRYHLLKEDAGFYYKTEEDYLYRTGCLTLFLSSGLPSAPTEYNCINIAKLLYAPGSNDLVIEDTRPHFEVYYGRTGLEDYSSIENIDLTGVDTEYFDDIDLSTSISPIYHSDSRRVYKLPIPGVYDCNLWSHIKHCLGIRSYSGGTNIVGRCKVFPGLLVKDGTDINLVYEDIPEGTTSSFDKVSFLDAYDPSIESATAQEIHTPAEPDIMQAPVCSCRWLYNFPAFKIKLRHEEAVDRKYFAQIWVMDTGTFNMQLPPTFEIPITQEEDFEGIIGHPYLISPEQSSAYIVYRIVNGSQGAGILGKLSTTKPDDITYNTSWRTIIANIGNGSLAAATRFYFSSTSQYLVYKFFLPTNKEAKILDVRYYNFAATAGGDQGYLYINGIDTGLLIEGHDGVTIPQAGYVDLSATPIEVSDSVVLTVAKDAGADDYVSFCGSIQLTMEYSQP